MKGNSSLQWKLALWDRASLDPAMLRVPLVAIIFTGLWTLNIWIFERCRVQYTGVLGMKNSPLQFLAYLTVMLTLGYTIFIHVSLAIGLPVEIALTVFYTMLCFALFVLPVFVGPPSNKGFSPRNNSTHEINEKDEVHVK